MTELMKGLINANVPRDVITATLGNATKPQDRFAKLCEDRKFWRWQMRCFCFVATRNVFILRGARSV